MHITITYVDDEGLENEMELPAVNKVCPLCEGHGTHLRPSIGEHAYTREEFEEAFDDEESRAEYFRHGGRYDVVCEECHGKNVIAVVDEEACERTPELRAALEAYYAHLDEEAEYRRECEAERRAGC